MVFMSILKLSKEIVHKVIELIVTVVDAVLDLFNIFKKEA